MKNRFFHAGPVALALGFAALASMPVRAADLVGEEPPTPAPMEQAAPAGGWSGGYAGIAGSYGFGKARHTQPANSRLHTSGGNSSVFAGYQNESDGMVYGVEGDLGYGNVKGNNASNKVKTGLDGSARARFGYAASPNVLLYGTGGVAAANAKVTEGGASDSRAMVGWTAGAGADVKLTDQVFARAEYRHTDYGSKRFATGSGVNKVDVSQNRVTLGLGVKF